MQWTVLLTVLGLLQLSSGLTILNPSSAGNSTNNDNSTNPDNPDNSTTVEDEAAQPANSAEVEEPGPTDTRPAE